MNPLYDFIGYPMAAPQKGKTMLIMGTARDGPVNAPIPITSEERALELFGADGSLYRSYLQAFNTDSSLTIYLMRVTGAHARASLYGLGDGMMQPVISISSIYGGASYNEMQATIKETDLGVMLVFSMPTDSRFQPIGYNLSNYDNIGMLLKAINEDSRAGIHPIYASSKFPDEPLTPTYYLNRPTMFAGGEDGLAQSKDDLFMALDYSYTLLEGFYMDVIVCPDAKFDDVSPISFYEDASEYGGSYYAADRDYLALKDTQGGDRAVTFHGRLITFCKRQMGFGIMTHGVIGLNKVNNPAYLEANEMSYVLDLVLASAFKSRYDLAVFAGGSWSDSGYYVSVVGGELIYNVDTDEEYFDNWAVTYAAMIAGLGAVSTTTNLTIPGNMRLRYSFTPDELGELSYIGVVTPRDSVRKGLVVTTGVTASLPGTDTHNIANIRQVQIALAMLNEALDAFEGQSLTPLLKNKAIDKVVEGTLSELKKQGILIDYKFNIEYDRYRGSASVNVDLLAKQMVDYMSTAATLSFS